MRYWWDKIGWTNNSYLSSVLYLKRDFIKRSLYCYAIFKLLFANNCSKSKLSVILEIIAWY